jgi:hypothetical protein
MPRESNTTPLQWSSFPVEVHRVAFAPEQMFRRSVKMLQRPGTNVAQLGAAIKPVRLLRRSKIPITAYSSERA